MANTKDSETTWSSIPTRDTAEFRRKDTGQPVPMLTIACHPDLRRIGGYARLDELLEGRVSGISRLEPLFIDAPDGKGRALGDPFVSRKPLFLETSMWGLTVRKNPDGMKVRINGQDMHDAVHLNWDEVDAGVTLDLVGRVTLVLNRRTSFEWAEDTLGLVGRSEAVEQVRADIHAVAGKNVPALLTGETGTGKELVARAIHQLSLRARRPFVSVNMAAIPVSTAVSQLFGHAKGAFTGAVRQHPGYFGQADGGTLFLDEVGDMPTDVQVALLRVLETGELQPVGETDTRTVDVRLVSATDSDLEAAIGKERFRGSLLHRLGGFQIVLPPLRNRREDIARLLFHFLATEMDSDGDPSLLEGSPPDEELWLTADVMSPLILHPWPGNVRQLRNVARRMLMHTDRPLSVAPGSPLGRILKNPDREATVPMRPVPAARPAASAVRPAEIDEETLLGTLRETKFNLRATARKLNISPTSLYSLIEQNPRIRKAGDLTRAEILKARDAVGTNVQQMADHLEVSKRGLVRRIRDLGINV